MPAVEFYPLILKESHLRSLTRTQFLPFFKVTVKNIQPRLRHCTINFNDQLIIFGGSSGYNPTSGTYNDVWKFDAISVSREILEI